MSLFKKPLKKNLRARVAGVEETEEPMEVDVGEVKAAIKKKKKPKEKEDVKPKQTLLSFDEDLHDGDDGEIFQVKKSSQSKKLMRQLDKERRKRREQESKAANNGASMGVTVKMEPPSPALSPSRASPPLIVRELRPIKKENHILNGREAEFARERSESDEEEEAPRFSKPKQLKQVLESGCIPDAAMIHAARKSRQKAREMGGDYIPMEDSKNSESSRLNHDDEQDGSEEEEEGEDGVQGESKRLDFTVDTSARDQERRREAFFAAQEEEPTAESDLEDDELENWEQQQIRKAVTGAQLVAAQQEVLQQQAVSANLKYRGRHIPAPRPVAAVQAIMMGSQVKQEPGAAQVLAQMPVKTEAPDPDELARSLRDRLSSLRETQRRHAQDKERALAELAEARSEVERLGLSEQSRSQRFQFYQDLRGYVTDLVECFDEKLPLLESLEARALALQARRTTQFVQRRRQDVADQSEEAAALSRPAGVPGPSPEQEEARTRRAAEREGRRARRRRARDTRPPGTEPAHVRHFEGLSSDDEQTDLEVTSTRSLTEQLERDGKLMFNDTLDEFSSIKDIMARFEEWKKFDLDSYKEAFVHLALPKIFSPLIRLKLLTWTPLEDSPVTLENSRWFQTLALYGLRAEETPEIIKNDVDVNLLPLVVEMAVLPKLARIVVEAWDPCSTSQTQRLCATLRHILTEYPQLASRGRVSKSLMPAVVDKLRDAVDNDVFIPIYPTRPAATVFFFQRQFWFAVKLMRNILVWRGLLSDATLQELAMAALLGRYLLLGLRTCEPLDALEKSRYIMASIPRPWLQRNPQLMQLQLFANQVTNIVKAIDVSLPGGREALMEALAMLKSLGAKTKAEELGKIYL